MTGVYNAQAKTMDVYLNGELDNGFLVGPVTGSQTTPERMSPLGGEATLTATSQGRLPMCASIRYR